MSSQPKPPAALSEEFDNETALAVVDSWPAVLVTGIITVAFGVIVLAWPDETLKVMSVLLGIHLLVFGLFRLVAAFSSQTSARGLTGFVGIVGMIAGVVVVRNPFETVAVLATVLGVAWIVGGSIDFISAIADRHLRDRGWTAIMGVVSVIAGIVVVAWPAPTVTVIAWIAGIYLIIFGLVFCIGAFRLKSLES